MGLIVTACSNLCNCVVIYYTWVNSQVCLINTAYTTVHAAIQQLCMGALMYGLQGLFQDFASEGANAKFQNSRGGGGGGEIQSQGGATPY